MPIHVGTSTKNQQQISFGSTQMQKVYVGDKLVWQKLSPITTIKYGLLYNWWTATDNRNICAIGWRIAESNDYFIGSNSLSSIIGGDSFGEKLMDTGNTYWANNIGTNTIGFNARGNSKRLDTGTFNTSSFRNSSFLWTNTNSSPSYAYIIEIIGGTGELYGRDVVSNKKTGQAIRLIKNSTTLTNGQTGTYTGNDGKVYRTICIGTQEWLADNLAETKYRNGDSIPEVTSNSVWAALTTGALCAYNNDWSNV